MRFLSQAPSKSFDLGGVIDKIQLLNFDDIIIPYFQPDFKEKLTRNVKYGIISKSGNEPAVGCRRTKGDANESRIFSQFWLLVRAESLPTIPVFP